jgi:hypothetical protein
MILVECVGILGLSGRMAKQLVFVCELGRIIEVLTKAYKRWRTESNKVMNVEAVPLSKIYVRVYKKSPEAKNLFSKSVCASGLEDGVLVSTC